MPDIIWDGILRETTLKIKVDHKDVRCRHNPLVGIAQSIVWGFVWAKNKIQNKTLAKASARFGGSREWPF